jgi:hypothetical protein
MTTALIVAAIGLASLVALWRLTRAAPLAWQDSDGFHHGKPDLGSLHDGGI